MRAWRSLLLALIAAPAFGQAPEAPHVSGAAGAAARFSFCVLGHLRGDDNGQMLQNLDEVVREVTRLQPDLVFLTGDLIWGDVNNPKPADPAMIRADWVALDAALSQIPAPILRVPGNHDICDQVTRDIWNERYGALPRAFTFEKSRFFLFASGWIPEDTDQRKHPMQYVRGRKLDPTELAFLKAELELSEQYDHVFILMHHMLWWEDSAAWWRDVHPLLPGHKVRAVFAGDYGPMKFSHLERDGIDYLQSSLENVSSLEMLRIRELTRQLSAQFDNFLYVTVDGPDVHVDVRTVGALTTDKFTPQQWRLVNEYDKNSLQRRLYARWGSQPSRLFYGVLKISAVSFLAGLVLVASLLGLRRLFRGSGW
jgi:hypothetical protein